MVHPWMIFPGRMAAFFVASILFLHSSIQVVFHATQDLDSSTKKSSLVGSFVRTADNLAAQQQSLDRPLEVTGRSNSIVMVNVYVESLCIDSKAYFQEQLMPTYEALGPAVMSLRVTVFGNAKIENSTSNRLECQHGQG
jgi:Gamma interferon inducible lysosomal thiol reductase (GILT)